MRSARNWPPLGHLLPLNGPIVAMVGARMVGDLQECHFGIYAGRRGAQLYSSRTLQFCLV